MSGNGYPALILAPQGWSTGWGGSGSPRATSLLAKFRPSFPTHAEARFLGINGRQKSSCSLIWGPAGSSRGPHGRSEKACPPWRQVHPTGVRRNAAITPVFSSQRSARTLQARAGPEGRDPTTAPGTRPSRPSSLPAITGRARTPRAARSPRVRGLHGTRKVFFLRRAAFLLRLHPHLPFGPTAEQLLHGLLGNHGPASSLTPAH